MHRIPLNPPKDKSALVVRRADQIDPQPIKWVWPGRIAVGKITIVAGDPGLGKSQLALHTAAVITHGGEWPCNEGNAPIGSIIVLSAEDGPEDTIIPRLLAYGADRKKIHIIEAVRARGKDGRRLFTLQHDLLELENLIEKIGDVVLVVIDPLSVYLGKVASFNNTSVRRVLAPFAEMAERMQVAVLAVTHCAKSAKGKAIHRFIDSIAFAATARTAFLVLQDNEDKSRLLFLQAKNNLAKPAGGLAFRLMPVHVGPRKTISSSVLSFESKFVDKTVDEVLAVGSSSEHANARDKCKDFLIKVLADGPILSTQIQRLAKKEGLGFRTVCEVKKELGIVSVRKKGEDDEDCWYWEMR